MRNRTDSLITFLLVAIVFLAIIPYGSAHVWVESFVFSFIFLLTGFVVWRGDFDLREDESRRLIVPLVLLGAYSFLQALATLLVLHEAVPASVVPYSFDLTASLRSGFKILALTCFICLWLVFLRAQLKTLIWGLIFTGNFFAIFGIFRYSVQKIFPAVNQYFFLSHLDAGVGFGTFINQNHFALLMLMTFGFNAAFFWLGNCSRVFRFYLLLLTVISWTALTLTASRGGIISSFAVIAVLVLFATAKRQPDPQRSDYLSRLFSVWKKLTIFAVFSVVLTIGVGLIGQDRVLERFEDLRAEVGSAKSVQTFRRIDVWKAGIEMARQHWLFGTGFGGFRFAVPRYADISGQINPDQAHNDYLEFLTSGGVIALALFVWFAVVFSKIVKKRFREPGNYFSSVARVGALCGIGGVALHSFFDFGLQFTANALFFAGLIAVAVHRAPVEERADDLLIKRKQPLAPRSIFAAMLAALAVSSAFFGYSRFVQYRSHASGESLENASARLFFDSDLHARRAELHVSGRSFPEAVDALEKAVFYRPEDYDLWLKLALLEADRDRFDAAEKAFRKAVELAPSYGEPRFLYGNFLVRNDRATEGFAELINAFRRDRRYVGNVVETIWRETGENSDRLIGLLSPLSESESEYLAFFLFSEKRFQAMLKLACVSRISRELRDVIVRRLFESNRFHLAWQVRENACSEPDFNEIDFIDGDFENGRLQKGFGFGWRIGDELGRANLTLDAEDRAAGRYSLKFDLDGNYEHPLISQIVVTRKNTSYALEFSYKTADLTTGSTPVWQVILHDPENHQVVREIEMPVEKTDWITQKLKIETSEETQAVEVRLTQKPCGQSTCPIYGNIWIDDFRLARVEN